MLTTFQCYWESCCTWWVTTAGEVSGAEKGGPPVRVGSLQLYYPYYLEESPFLCGLQVRRLGFSGGGGSWGHLHHCPECTPSLDRVMPGWGYPSGNLWSVRMPAGLHTSTISGPFLLLTNLTTRQFLWSQECTACNTYQPKECSQFVEVEEDKPVFYS